MYELLVGAKAFRLGDVHQYLLHVLSIYPGGFLDFTPPIQSLSKLAKLAQMTYETS